MLIDTEALVRHASAVKTQASEVASMLAHHRARLTDARQHAAKQFKAQVDMMTADHEAFNADIEELWKQIDDAVMKLSGMEPAKPTPEKEPADEKQEG
jgi:phosphoribosylaminoimidazole carboxylase (NCAIR synthetase)